jgi:hypothetical protein
MNAIAIAVKLKKNMNLKRVFFLGKKETSMLLEYIT